MQRKTVQRDKEHEHFKNIFKNCVMSATRKKCYLTRTKEYGDMRVREQQRRHGLYFKGSELDH